MDTLTRMQAYVDVVEAGGYSPAARKIGRSKALLSKYVRELEDELGILLINRTTRQFSLTEPGQIYYQSALDILQRVAHLRDQVRESGAGLSGKLRIAAPRSLSGGGFSLPFVEFAAAYPDLRLEIQLEDRIIDLVEERFDVAVRVTRLEDSSLIARRLADFTMVICATPEFLARHGTPASPRDILALPCIVDTNSKGRTSWVLEDAGKEIILPVSAVIEANDPELCKDAALAGLGLTMVPEFSVEKELAEGRLVSVLDDHVPKGAGFHAVYAHRRHVPAKVRVFVDFMSDWFRKRR